MKQWFLFLLVVGVADAAPRQPSIRVLNPDKIQRIAVHREINTLLIFPEKVTLAMGHGLTDGSVAGVIHQEHAKDSKVLVWRYLGGADKILVQVMLDGEAFAFRVFESDSPETVIRFVRKKGPKPAQRITLPKDTKKKRRMSQARREQLLMLARSSAVLKSQLPNEFQNFKSLVVSSDHFESGISTTIQRVARFSDEDALLLFGSVTNTGEKAIRLESRQAYLIVGKKRQYLLQKPSFGEAVLAPREKTNFECSLIGDGRGGKAHLSVENRFRLRLLP